MIRLIENKYKDGIIGDYIEVDNFEITSKNRSSHKWYAPLYKEFNEKIVYPKSFLDQMYSNRYVRHFYSGAEIENFKKKYLEKS